jgi:putative ATP-dependent endonuclease of OLD family
MGILVKAVRVSGFRGIKNLEVELEQTTILTGMNNTGKTSFLKAIQLALGGRQFLSSDDFFNQNNEAVERIVIDLLVIPAEAGERADAFSEGWEILFTTDRIRYDVNGDAFIPLRTIVTFDEIKNGFKTQQYILQGWPDFLVNNANWFESNNGTKTTFRFDEVPFFYMDAQRDILEDTKLKSSYIGRMLSKIQYSPEDIEAIEAQIQLLNERAVNSSDILTSIKNTLRELDSAIGGSEGGVEITPFTKKIRDLSKGVSIYYSDSNDSFPMEYHGMGTRSWSSLLTLKAFITLLSSSSHSEGAVLFPIMALEEPEAHLHPNAQKKLYSQMNAISGQKVISTHSPYIAAAAELNQIRSFYKGDELQCGGIDTRSLSPEDLRKINRQVINTRGEIFFSKLIVFFEGETEEQALPIFFEKHFGLTPVEVGVDFVGVGGYTAYLPFLRFAESLKIPWLILSDAEVAPNDIKGHVKGLFQQSHCSRPEAESVVFLDDGFDIERQLINDGYQNEIKGAVASFDVYQNEQHREAAEPRRLQEIQGYDDNELYGVITGSKTRFGPAVAEKIIDSNKVLPPKILALFELIGSALASQRRGDDS